MVDKSFEYENASENAAERFVQPGSLIDEIVGVSDNLDSLFSYVVIMELEMMRVAAPHIGVEPCAGAKTDVMGFPRVVVECLLALAQ